MKQGYGKQLMSDGSIYLGMFLKNLKEGKGILLNKEGKQNEGFWQVILSIMLRRNGEYVGFENGKSGESNKATTNFEDF